MSVILLSYTVHILFMCPALCIAHMYLMFSRFLDRNHICRCDHLQPMLIHPSTLCASFVYVLFLFTVFPDVLLRLHI